jgi:hypothetical protein
VTIRDTVSLHNPWAPADDPNIDYPDNASAYALTQMMHRLLWWAHALRTARQRVPYPASCRTCPPPGSCAAAGSRYGSKAWPVRGDRLSRPETLVLAEGLFMYLARQLAVGDRDAPGPPAPRGSTRRAPRGRSVTAGGEPGFTPG